MSKWCEAAQAYTNCTDNNCDECAAEEEKKGSEDKCQN